MTITFAGVLNINKSLKENIIALEHLNISISYSSLVIQEGSFLNCCQVRILSDAEYKMKSITVSWLTEEFIMVRRT